MATLTADVIIMIIVMLFLFLLLLSHVGHIDKINDIDGININPMKTAVITNVQNDHGD